MIVANDTYLSRVIFMDGRKGGANCWDAMHRDVWVDIQAIVVDRFAWNDFNQREVFMDNRYIPTETAGQLVHCHVVNFFGGNDLNSLRHHHEREHRAVIIMQVCKKNSRNLIF